MGRESLPVSTSPNDQIRELKREHRQLEERLEELNGYVYLTQDEQVERRRIQKMKLRKKDKLLRITQELD